MNWKYLFTLNQYKYYTYNEKFVRKSLKKTEVITDQFFLQMCDIAGFEYKE